MNALVTCEIYDNEVKPLEEIKTEDWIDVCFGEPYVGRSDAKLNLPGHDGGVLVKTEIKEEIDIWDPIITIGCNEDDNEVKPLEEIKTEDWIDVCFGEPYVGRSDAKLNLSGHDGGVLVKTEIKEEIDIWDPIITIDCNEDNSAVGEQEDQTADGSLGPALSSIRQLSEFKQDAFSDPVVVETVKAETRYEGAVNSKPSGCVKSIERTSKARSPLLTIERPFKCVQCYRSYASKYQLKAHARLHTGENVFPCIHCGKCFPFESSLRYHLQTHTGEKPFICGQCNKGFTRRYQLNDHLRAHTGERPFICDQCKRGFNRRSNLMSHLRVHTDKKPFICDRCKRGFNTRSNLISHLRVNIDKKPFICGQCNEHFTRLCSLNNHLRLQTDKKAFICAQCNKGFTTRSILKAHLPLHTVKKPFISGECKKTFAQLSQLRAHLRSHHDTDQMYSCSNCNKRFGTIDSLNSHFESHGISEFFICCHCNKCFTSKLCLRVHIGLHLRNAKKCYSCIPCKKVFTNLASLRSHLSLEHKHNPFFCKHCNKICFSKSSFNAHLRSHIRDNLSCTQCDQHFPDIASLNEHLINHSGATFVCNQCGEQFSEVSSLNVHLRAHGPSLSWPFAFKQCGKRLLSVPPSNSIMHGERRAYEPWICVECGKKFLTQSGLKIHSATHKFADANPYRCDKCGAQFTHHYFLEKHMKCHKNNV